MTREVLARFRTRALRQQVWFRALDHLERGLVDLTMRWVDQVKRGRLRRVLMEILAKLVRVLDTGMVKALERGKRWAARSSDLCCPVGEHASLSLEVRRSLPTLPRTRTVDG